MIKLISIIDEFDSLLYERPYKDAMPINNVRELLLKKFTAEEDKKIIDLLYDYKKLDFKDYQEKQLKIMNSQWHRQEAEKDLGHQPSRNELVEHFNKKGYSEKFAKRNRHLRIN